MVNRLKKYHSKVLLFGEYTVLSGGNALAIPIKNLSAVFQKSTVADETLTAIFYRWCHYLREKVEFISVEKLKQDWETGYRFEMNIPVGYGAGSSGVLTAIVYDQYRNDSGELGILDLKKRLAMMESFFHGESSGLDPLVSYLDKPLLVQSGGVSVIDRDLNFGEWKFYLLDSGEGRSTAALVPEFKKRVKASENFRKKIEEELKSEVNLVLEIIAGGKNADISENIKRISRFQFENMSWLIHKNVRKIWEESLSNSDRVIKICGAGGGGYYLMFSREKEMEIDLPIIGPIDLGR